MTTQLSPLTVDITKSELMVWYNRARVAGKRGKLEVNRINQALGWLQKKEPHIYQTTVKSCSCTDHKNNPQIACKHMIGIMILSRIVEKREADKMEAQKQIRETKPQIETVEVGVQKSRSAYIKYIFSNQDEYQSWLEHNGFSPNQFKTLDQLSGHIDKVYNMVDWEINWPFKAQSVFVP